MTTAKAHVLWISILVSWAPKTATAEWYLVGANKCTPFGQFICNSIPNMCHIAEDPNVSPIFLENIARSFGIDEFVKVGDYPTYDGVGYRVQFAQGTTKTLLFTRTLESCRRAAAVLGSR